MNFRISEGIRAPLMINAQFNAHGRSRGSVKLTVSANMPENVVVSLLKVVVPMPPNLAGVNILNCKLGKAKQRKSGDAIEWRIGTLQSGLVGELEIEITTAVAMNFDLREWKKDPIHSEFEIERYAASGVEIRVFSVNMGNVNGNVAKNLSTVTLSGNYFNKW